VDLSLPQAVAGLVVGAAIGLTGVGGGALLAPVMVLLFSVPAAVAISSDLVVSLCVKPVGSAVHLRPGNARLDITRWLMIGSVPAAFAGVSLLRLIGVDDAPALGRRPRPLRPPGAGHRAGGQRHQVARRLMAPHPDPCPGGRP
jgi:hypothetical protein